MAKRRDTSVKAMLMELEMSLNTLVHMKNSMPRADTLAKIADYLQCSVDYLLERTEEIPTAGTGQQAPSLPENSREMLTLFEQLPERQQLILIGRLQEMVAPMAPDDTIETAAPRHDEGKAV
ncbi:helix-turn-helix domain-containing protein [Intestinimonas butyriciproducens]|uniref:helix-turn-helix domain-containing protein n=1 Tax=Intestinimonas butyriciproducens TaxID=1297617 RepID=UPI0031B57101